MAIVVQEQQSSSGNLLSVFIWLVMLSVIGWGFYYVFFKAADIIPIAPNANLASTEQISRISLNPSEVIDKLQPPLFQSYVTISPASTAGRVNPFLGF